MWKGNPVTEVGWSSSTSPSKWICINDMSKSQSQSTAKFIWDKAVLMVKYNKCFQFSLDDFYILLFSIYSIWVRISISLSSWGEESLDLNQVGFPPSEYHN